MGSASWGAIAVVCCSLSSPMFCFCLQNSLLKLQALESDLCSAFLPTQEETPQLPVPKDPALSSVQTSAQADGASCGGKRPCRDHTVAWCILICNYKTAVWPAVWYWIRSPRGNSAALKQSPISRRKCCAVWKGWYHIKELKRTALTCWFAERESLAFQICFKNTDAFIFGFSFK